jgi:ATP synthase protein I
MILLHLAWVLKPSAIQKYLCVKTLTSDMKPSGFGLEVCRPAQVPKNDELRYLMQNPLGEDTTVNDTLPRFRRIDDENRLPKQLLRSEPVRSNRTDDSVAAVSTASANPSSMQEYHTLKRSLYLLTLAITAISFAAAWIAYSADTALSYLIGSLSGILYLRMLAKGVERLGVGASSTGGNSRLAIFVGLIVVAAQVERLQLVPVFLGFITYKISLLAYSLVIGLRESWQPSSNKL